MCFIHIDIFTQSLWLMNKHQLQNHNKTKRKVLATSAQNKWSLGSVHFQFHSNHKWKVSFTSSRKSISYQSFLQAIRPSPSHPKSVWVLKNIPFVNWLNWKCIGPSPELNMIKLMSHGWKKKKNLKCSILQFGVQRRLQNFYPVDQ